MDPEPTGSAYARGKILLGGSRGLNAKTRKKFMSRNAVVSLTSAVHEHPSL